MAREAEVDGRARELSERELSDDEELSDEELDRPSLTALLACYTGAMWSLAATRVQAPGGPGG